MKKLIGLGLSAMILTGGMFFAGCEGGGGDGGGAKKPDANVAGVWQGVLESNEKPPVQSTFRFELKQATNSLAVSGSAQTTSPAVFTSAKLAGEVNGRNMSFSGTSRDGVLHGSFGGAFRAAASGDTMEMSAVLVKITGGGTNAVNSASQEYYGILERVAVSN